MSVQNTKVEALVECMKSSGVSEAVINDFEEAIDSVKCRVYTLMTTMVERFGDVSSMLAPRSQELAGLLKANEFLATPTIELLGIPVTCSAKSATHSPIADLKVAHMDLTSSYLAELLPWLVKQWDARSNSKGFSFTEHPKSMPEENCRRTKRKRKQTSKMRDYEREKDFEVRLTFISTNLSSSCLHHWAHKYPPVLRNQKRMPLSG